MPTMDEVGSSSEREKSKWPCRRENIGNKRGTEMLRQRRHESRRPGCIIPNEPEDSDKQPKAIIVPAARRVIVIIDHLFAGEGADVAGVGSIAPNSLSTWMESARFSSMASSKAVLETFSSPLSMNVGCSRMAAVLPHAGLLRTSFCRSRPSQFYAIR